MPNGLTHPSRQTAGGRRRGSRSTVRVDASEYLDSSEVVAYAAHLNALGSGAVDAIWEDWKKHWNAEVADELRASVPRGEAPHSRASQRYGPLHSAVRAVVKGVTFGDAFYWRFLEYGTSKMPPRPTVRPVLKRLRPAMRRDAAQRAVSALMMDG